MDHIDSVCKFGDDLNEIKKIYNICKKGNLNEIKKIVNNENVNLIFGASCEYGNLDIIKYLIRSYKVINIHGGNECAFRRGCKNGHLEIIKYLIRLDGKINIHSDNESAYMWSCSHGRIEIIKYLMEVYVGYDYKISDDKKIIPIIKSIKKIGIMNNLKLKSELINCLREFKFRDGNMGMKCLSVKFNSDIDMEINLKYICELNNYFGCSGDKLLNILDEFVK